MENDNKKQLTAIFFFPVYVVALMWIVKLTELIFSISFVKYGLYPRTLKGITGIFTFPFIHADFEHLVNNSAPMIIIGAMIFYFYRPVAYRVYFFTYILTGVLTWIIGREAYHIGASGMVYSFASFIFFSGLIRQHPRLMTMSLLVVFLYGSMAWGIFPMKQEISWEGHVSGAVIGFALAFIYRKKGMQRVVYDWESNDDFDYNDFPYNGPLEETPQTKEHIEDITETNQPARPFTYNYIYVPANIVKDIDETKNTGTGTKEELN